MQVNRLRKKLGKDVLKSVVSEAARSKGIKSRMKSMFGNLGAVA